MKALLGLFVVIVVIVAIFAAGKSARDRNAAARTYAEATASRSNQQSAIGIQQSGTPASRTTVESLSPLSRSQSVGAGGFGDVPHVVLGTGEPRMFSIRIERAMANKSGAAIGAGGFYDIPPEVTTEPEKMGTGKRQWTQSGQIAVFGIPDAIDGQPWKGWLERDSTATYATLLDGDRTVPSYRVIPDPVAKPYVSPVRKARRFPDQAALHTR